MICDQKANTALHFSPTNQSSVKNRMFQFFFCCTLYKKELHENEIKSVDFGNKWSVKKNFVWSFSDWCVWMEYEKNESTAKRILSYFIFVTLNRCVHCYVGWIHNSGYYQRYLSCIFFNMFISNWCLFMIYEAFYN